MAPSRNSSNGAPPAQAAPYRTRSTATGNPESSIPSTKDGCNISDDTTDDQGDGHGEDSYTRASGAREKCTDEQLDALNDLFWRVKGFPTREEKEELAAQIGKSFHSTNVWMQNRRHPRDQTKKPWFLVPGAIDPAIDPTAPIYPLDGVISKSPAKKVKKDKTPVKKATSACEVSFKGVTTRESIYTRFLAPVLHSGHRLADVAIHNSVSPAYSHSSGDSNGSAPSTPRISPSRFIPEPACNQATTELPAMSRDQAAAILLIMSVHRGQPSAPLMGNPSGPGISQSSPVGSRSPGIPVANYDMPAPFNKCLNDMSRDYTELSITQYVIPTVARYAESNARASSTTNGEEVPFGAGRSYCTSSHAHILSNPLALR